MRITANQVSFMRIVLLPVPVYLLYRGPAGQWAAITLFALLGITDYIDGYLARRYGSTEFGKFLDPISDKIMIAAMFVPLLDLGVFGTLPILLLFARELSVTELRTIYNRTGASFKTSMMGKYKTNVQIFGVVIAVMHGLLDGTLVMPVLVAVLSALFFVVAAAMYLRTGSVHPYLLLFLSLFPLLLIAEDYLTLRGLHAFAAAVILFFTLYSGIEYYLGGWTHFRKYLAEAPARRISLFVAQGFLVPAVFCLLVARDIGPAWIPLAILALEFTCGGLDNFLTMHGKSFSYRWKVAELVGQLGPATLALLLRGPAAGPLLLLSLAVTMAYATTYVFTHRADLAVGSRPTPAA